MKYRKLIFGALIFSMFYAVSCRKDLSLLPNKPTPVVLEKPRFFPPFIALKGNQLTEEGIALGRQLFYDPILSLDSSQSCASCHNQKNAFTDNGLAISTGIKGIAGFRNSMPLFNLNWHDKGFFWDGRSKTLQEQILIPIEDPIEMASSIPDALKRLNRNSRYNMAFYKAFGTQNATEKELAMALEQFLLTLISSNSKFDKWRRGQLQMTQQELDGLAFTQAENSPRNGIRGGDCFHCHGTSGELFSNNDFTNNGLNEVSKDQGHFITTGLERDKGKFKTPSLRNLSYTAPYMHDGRFKTLENVLDHYGLHVKLNAQNIDPNMKHSRTFGQIEFTRQEKDDMLAFLKTLDDETFITNPAFSNPFNN